jgi:hypothetical protein
MGPSFSAASYNTKKNPNYGFGFNGHKKTSIRYYQSKKAKQDIFIGHKDGADK